MKILFAGGGTGGHFFPIIAVAEELNDLMEREHVVGVKLYYMSDSPFDQNLLNKTGLKYVEVQTGKMRTYFSVQNILDVFKTISACVYALIKIFIIYPDVIFGKGGYASFPALFAARILRIPVVIHESDVIPGRVNKWIAKYAQNIAISYPEAMEHFPKKGGIALTGQPIRKNLLDIPADDPFDALLLEKGVPVVFVLGGSQGAELINETLMDILGQLVEKYQVVHQTGENNIVWMKKRSESVLAENPHAARYHPFPFLESKQLRLAAKASTLVISRAGSTIFEIAIWNKPAILIPLAIARDNHQRENAYSYARTGAATVIEEQNLKPGLLLSVIQSIVDDNERQSKMISGCVEFVKTDAAAKIAQVLLSVTTKHE